MSNRIPAVFIGHGSPTNVLEDNAATRYWAELPSLVGPINAILCISAHWYIPQTAVTAMPQPPTIHDFGRGLPAPLFDIQYPAPGSPELAQRVAQLLGSEDVVQDESWGLDHGTWSVLCRAWPAADVPVVQLSINASQPDRWHWALAQKLKPLRDEGVLILGSGNLVHNLGVMEWSQTAEPYDWAVRFNDFIKQGIEQNDIETLLAYADRSADARLAVADLDHFLPLFYVLGARQETDQVKFATDFIEFKSLSMTSFMLT